MGGGASGIVAAISAAEKLNGSAEVVILEQNPRIGKKILATGNGRCNFDNASAFIDKYYTSNKYAAEEMLDIISENTPVGWFADHGLISREEEGRLYPYSNQAADLLNLLLYWVDKLNIKVLTEHKVADIFAKGQSFGVVCENGEKLFGEAVICALGGSAAPQFGTDGFGTRLAKLCGCKIEPLYPCLVPLKCDKKLISGLSGIRVKANAALLFDGMPHHTESGEIQFTDYGLSGIAVMQLSGFLTPKQKGLNAEISLDLFPQLDEQQLFSLLADRAKLFCASPISDLSTGLINRRIFSAVWKRLGIGEESRLISSLGPDELLMLTKSLKDWRFSKLEPTGWQHAQTTGGGIALSQIDSRSFAFKGCNGLYFVGETLDCTGFCGGFNLHWAFGSGIAAGHSAAEHVKSLQKKR